MNAQERALVEFVGQPDYAAIRAAAHVDNGECMFPDSHAPGHTRDQRFSVLFSSLNMQDSAWEELTEEEMVAKYGHVLADGSVVLPTFLHSSDWDFWYAP